MKRNNKVKRFGFKFRHSWNQYLVLIFAVNSRQLYYSLVQKSYWIQIGDINCYYIIATYSEAKLDRGDDVWKCLEHWHKIGIRWIVLKFKFMWMNKNIAGVEIDESKIQKPFENK